MADRSTKAPKSKPFKPVRPATNTAIAKPSSRPAVTASSSRTRPSASSYPDSASDDEPSISNVALQEEAGGSEELGATIPPELLTRLLHEFFTDNSKMRINKGADRAVGKYMETFVREAIARAAYEKEDGFLEVEDLEKLAPQLLLDF